MNTFARTYVSMRLVEQTVQEVAQKYLQKHYRFRARGKVFSQLELRTKKQFGGKRADGFLAFRHWIWGVYTVSMEAKSYKTLPAIRPYFDKKKFVWACAKAGLVFSIVTGAIAFLFTLEDGFVQYLLPLVMFLIGALAYGVLSYNSFRNYKMPVIDQLAQYPANEQWLAFSSDSLRDISLKKLETLKALCHRKGVGLLLVRSRNKIEVAVKPQTRWHFWNDFLRFYAKEQQIRKLLK